MVDRDYVQNQLIAIKFDSSRFNRTELEELHNVLIPEEKIYECVNGIYEGGVALLVATDIRVLLIDKKPMGFLNVDDLRFDMISDLDYSHRFIGAQITINCGMKNLLFKSFNQQRLRKLIGHVQHRMSEIKKEQTDHASSQKQHLEDINRQLQMYLLAQQQHLERQLSSNLPAQPPRPNPRLADYLFAQRLLEDFYTKMNNPKPEKLNSSQPEDNTVMKEASQEELLNEMAEAGRREILGSDIVENSSAGNSPQEIDLMPFRIASAKLPYLLRSRRYRQSPV